MYLRTPGGALFELASNTEQGFFIDEPEEELGTHMCIPPHWEDRRSEIDQLEPTRHPRDGRLNPHLAAPPVIVGRALARARRVAVLVHGRTQDPTYMLEHLVLPIDDPDVAYVLPAATGGSWYPGRYFEPRIVNEPELGHALEAAEAAIAALLDAGVPPQRIVIAGFSQGGVPRGRRDRAEPAPVRGRGGADAGRSSARRTT